MWRCSAVFGSRWLIVVDLDAVRGDVRFGPGVVMGEGGVLGFPTEAQGSRSPAGRIIALDTAAGRTHSRLGLTDPKHRAAAIARLHRGLADATNRRGRQRAFNHA